MTRDGTRAYHSAHGAPREGCSRVARAVRHRRRATEIVLVGRRASSVAIEAVYITLRFIGRSIDIGVQGYSRSATQKTHTVAYDILCGASIEVPGYFMYPVIIPVPGFLLP